MFSFLNTLGFLDFLTTNNSILWLPAALLQVVIVRLSLASFVPNTGSFLAARVDRGMYLRATEALNSLHSRGRRISNPRCKKTSLTPSPPGAFT
ncbi:hypothetical protein J6590_043262 [Homalodisca vitripennis]|nr:hypothetical protein J6590_043262 [Homalodisca vitripennis]